jgi:hypothetical protein
MDGSDAAYPLMGKISASAGLSKRELFAAMAMQGILADPRVDQEPSWFAFWAAKYADALIEELSREVQNDN